MKRDLIAKVKGSCSNINLKDIRFQIGTIEGSIPHDDTGNTHAMPALNQSEIEFARDTVRPVKDEQTSEVIRRLIEKDLARKKKIASSK